MEFGPVPTGHARGAILAHSVQTGAIRLRKGLLLEDDHIAALESAGLTEITVARLDAGDLHEDIAAARLAEAITAKGARLRLGRAATGRVNIFADTPGLAQIDPAAIDAFNAVNPMITVATVPLWQRMESGGMVATVKVIAYGVAQEAVTQACSVGSAAIGLSLPQVKTASFIETQTGPDPSSPKGEAAMRQRLERLGVDLLPRELVRHKIADLAQALAQAGGEVIFILTGSATSDSHDTAPQAVRKAGGTVEHFGMPVDPGNLLFIGDLGGKPIIGLPGCARSPALNGADWVLERILCGVPVKGRDIMGMGVGGLLKEIPSRPRPRER